MADNTDANREQHCVDIPFLRPCSIDKMNAYLGWASVDLPEPTRAPPRPDTPIGGNRD